MTLTLLAVACFIAAAIVAGIQRAWAIVLLAVGLACVAVADVPIQIG